MLTNRQIDSFKFPPQTIAQFNEFLLSRSSPSFFGKTELSRLNQIFFEKFELSRLNSFFSKKSSQSNFVLKLEIVCKSVFCHFWVDPAQLGFLTFGFSLDRSLAQLKKVVLGEMSVWTLAD